MDSVHSVDPDFSYANQLREIVQAKKGHADYQTTQKIKKIIDKVLVEVENGSVKKAEVDAILTVFGSKEFQVLLEGPRYFKPIKTLFSALMTRCFVDKVFKSSWEYAEDLTGTALATLYKKSPSMVNAIVLEVIAKKHKGAILEEYEKNESQFSTFSTTEKKTFYFLFMLMGLQEKVPEIYRRSSSFSDWSLIGNEYKSKLPQIFREDLQNALDGLEIASREIKEEVEIEAKQAQISWGYVKELSVAEQMKAKHRDIVKEVALHHKKEFVAAYDKLELGVLSPENFSAFLHALETKETWNDAQWRKFNEIFDSVAGYLPGEVFEEIDLVREDLLHRAEGLKVLNSILDLMSDIKISHPLVYKSLKELLAINEDAPPTQFYQIQQKLRAFQRKFGDLGKQTLPQDFVNKVKVLIGNYPLLFSQPY